MTTDDFLTWYREKKEAEFRIEPKDAYEKTWACRDFELSHLWQRSVFLAVFLLAIASAYGTIILNMYFPSEQNKITIEKVVDEKKNEKTIERIIEYSAKDITYQQQFIASGVCWLGISVSILWVMMAKGSKYWQEKYEAGIDAYEQGEAGTNIKEYPHHGNMPKLKSHQYNENIFSPKAGLYSVSKVNGTIGILSLIVFSFLEMFHFAKFLNLRFEKLTSLQYAMLSISFWLLIGANLFMILRFLCKSGETDE